MWKCEVKVGRDKQYVMATEKWKVAYVVFLLAIRSRPWKLRERAMKGRGEYNGCQRWAWKGHMIG